MTFLPTASRSGSWPVFTGHRSLPGDVTISGRKTGGGTKACTPTWTPQAALICAATAELTVGSWFTSVMGPDPSIPPPLPPSLLLLVLLLLLESLLLLLVLPLLLLLLLLPSPPPPLTSADRPKITNRGVAS